jgi:hypothetical protein
MFREFRRGTHAGCRARVREWELCELRRGTRGAFSDAAAAQPAQPEISKSALVLQTMYFHGINKFKQT